MPAKPKTETAENFVGSVFKFSISTYVNFAIYGLNLLLINFFVSASLNGALGIFINITNTLMTVAILGLDQSFIRFFHELPGKTTRGGLFRVCFGISSLFMLVIASVSSVFYSEELRLFFFTDASGKIMVEQNSIIPLLFLNAFFFMVARYFNVLYRMEQNLKIFTLQSILMTFFYRLFYLFAGFFGQSLFLFVSFSVAGLGAFALLFAFLRRDTLRPRKDDFSPPVLKAVLPYGLAVAPTAVLNFLNGLVSSMFVVKMLTFEAQGHFTFGIALSNLVTVVQAGFSTFWGPYMFANYKTQQVRIKKVHDFFNFIILTFFALLVAFEDIVFLILRNFAPVMDIFPIMMLSAVFNILCETTVYGIQLAKRPIFDTIGIALGFVCNIGLLSLFIPKYGLIGAALALAITNGVVFLFRTIIAQKFYPTIRNPLKTAAAILLAVALTAAGTVWAHTFLVKLLFSGIAVGIYCLMYRDEMLRCWRLGLSILKSLFVRGKA